MAIGGVAGFEAGFLKPVPGVSSASFVDLHGVDGEERMPISIFLLSAIFAVSRLAPAQIMV